MRKLLLALFCTALLASGCKKKNELHIYMYSEYLDPAIQAEFEKQTGWRIVRDEYESPDDVVARFRDKGAASKYDIIIASDTVIPALISLGAVQPLDLSKIPNASNLDKRFRGLPFDRDNKYTLAYQWGTVGLMFDKTKVPAGPVSWSLMLDPSKQPGKFLMMDSPRDMLGIALKYQGKSMNATNPQDIRAAADLLIKARTTANCQGFEGGVGGKNQVVSGDAVMSVVYNGDAIKAMAEQKSKPLDFKVPREGSVIWVDAMMLCSGSPNADMAQKFMNFILDSKVGAQLSNSLHYATPNAAAKPMIRKEDLQNPEVYPDDQMMGRLEFLRDVGQAAQIYKSEFSRIKNAGR